MVGEKCELKEINEFRGEYAFLSNFFPCKIQIRDYVFNSVEAAFQALKCPERASEFVGLTPSQAKRLGQQVQLSPTWEQDKVQYMYELLQMKFSNPLLGFWLRQTSSAILIEGNTWNDTFWGICNGKGQNMLGILLMRVREELNLLALKSN